MALAIGLLVAGGCGVETVPTGRVTPQSTVETSSTPTSSSVPPTTTATPTPTPERFVPPTTDLGEVSKQVDPPPSKTRPKTTPTAKAPNPADCGSDYYRNTDGVCVHRPASGPRAADGATALCKDGSYSYSQNRRGTCSGHGGVRTWL
ncbi:DUF3761 domain-containing protein [Amycolatopsis regifaucium]|uniref:DUF3761 domain-containing protein n=1 Tax=Amycolatopsis regifaucium TaxID=546365 RepID=A0A154MTZ0_9PSEU|nr:DUF3761 domain-containing protein [Amycolatopsis regifaucium]KZB87741.1 hypothetical protein AVL48_24415 [Amycolatopsis regifaucium]OKA05566.1 hypothetical protein ATP06_0226130 [Amycolatopsis regifaucium]